MSVLKIINAYPEVFKSENRAYTEAEAQDLILLSKSKGSDIQKASLQIHEVFLCITKLFKFGFREPAVALSKELLETSVYYQEYTISAELAKYLVNHAAQFDSQITSQKYMDLYEEYRFMADLEFKARQVFNKVYYNHEHHLETDNAEINKALHDIQKVMRLDSITYRAYFYQCQCLLSKGEEYLKWINEAIAYFENEYFQHDSYISHFKYKLIQNYINQGDTITALSLLEETIAACAEGNYAWLKYMFCYIELLAKEGRAKEAGEHFERATKQEVYLSLTEDDKQYWEVLRQMVYDGETIKANR